LFFLSPHHLQVEVEVEGEGYSPIASRHNSGEGSGDGDDDDDDEEEDSGSSVVVVVAAAAAATTTTTTPPSSHPATKPPAVEVLPRHRSHFSSAGGSGLNFNSGPAPPPRSILCKAPKYSHPAVAGVAAGTSDYGMANSVPSGMDLMPNHRPAGNEDEDEDDATLQAAEAVSGVAAGTVVTEQRFSGSNVNDEEE
jgi:hypothetical protein